MTRRLKNCRSSRAIRSPKRTLSAAAPSPTTTATIVPEIQAAQATLDRAEKGGRDKISFSAAQFHSGGSISDFGDLWTSADHRVHPRAARRERTDANANVRAGHRLCE